MTAKPDEIERAFLLTWDYFKLLAQQRVTHFNLFIVFAGAIAAVTVSQIGTDVRGNAAAAALGTAQMFLCFIFQKIDERNKFLIKQTEKTLKSFESDYANDRYRVFLNEEYDTQRLRDQQTGVPYFRRQLSTSQLYNLFYAVFASAGALGLVIASALIVRDLL